VRPGVETLGCRVHREDAVAAGPTLVRDGVFAVDAATERFDTRSNLWRATRQSAIGLLPDGRYLLAMLEHGTPEDMARALVLQGVRDALRLDSGTSSALYLQGGMAAGLWGRPVANAIAFLPR
ncbi:MAG TPA: phosphodiester glycosidase family protein, partial [Deinococcales bacterium]|nr:phosphodiester glycosidase family protein [Deinococcales bacterium]